MPAGWAFALGFVAGVLAVVVPFGMYALLLAAKREDQHKRDLEQKLRGDDQESGESNDPER